MPTDTPVLDYATTWPRWYRRRVVRRCLVLLLFAATTGGSWWAWNSKPGKWARFEYWRYRCEHYSAPPDKLVYLSGDAELLSSAPNLSTFPNDPWRGSEAFATCPEWTHLQAFCGWSPAAEAMTFLHGCPAANGRHRLIAAWLQPLPDGGVNPDNWWMSVVELVPSGGTIREAVVARGYYELSIAGHGKHRLRVFAGQRDRLDASHFTVAYTADGHPGTIDITVGEDGWAAATVRDGAPTPLHIESHAELLLTSD
jgi:hypothetical protein